MSQRRIFVGRCALLAVMAVCSLHCAITQPVRVLEPHQVAALGSLGGAIIPFSGIDIPLPYLNLGAAYGLSDQVTLTGTLHATSTFYKTIGLDAGAAVRVLAQHDAVPEVTAKGLVYFFAGTRSGGVRAFPMVTVNGSWRLGSWLAYVGADNLYQVQDPLYLVSPFVGTEFPLGGAWRGQVEVKWIAANRDTRHGVFEGEASLGGNGNAGLYFGAQYLFAGGTP